MMTVNEYYYTMMKIVLLNFDCKKLNRFITYNSESLFALLFDKGVKQ